MSLRSQGLCLGSTFVQCASAGQELSRFLGKCRKSRWIIHCSNNRRWICPLLRVAPPALLHFVFISFFFQRYVIAQEVSLLEKKYFQVVKLLPCSLKEKKSLLRECIYQQVFNPSGLAKQTFTSHSYPTPKWGACGSFHTVAQGTRLLPSEEFLGPQSVPAEPLYPVSGRKANSDISVQHTCFCRQVSPARPGCSAHDFCHIPLVKTQSYGSI